MKIGRCPACHFTLHLEAIVQDSAASDLARVFINLDRPAGQALVSYLSLFRSKSRDLANDRAFKLATETLDLAPVEQLVPALINVVQQMQAKQAAGGFKPLSNHNYLRKVLDSAVGTAVVDSDIESLPSELQSQGNNKSAQRARVTEALMDIKNTDW